MTEARRVHASVFVSVLLSFFAAASCSSPSPATSTPPSGSSSDEPFSPAAAPTSGSTSAPSSSSSSSAAPAPTGSATGAPATTALDIGATDSVDDVGFNFAAAHADGLTRTSFYTRWRDLEPTAGSYRFADIDDITSRARAAGLKLTLEIEITNTDCVEYGMTDAECVTPLFPSDMPYSRTGAGFDDPVIAKRLAALVGAIADRYDPSVLTHVFVGNEVDRYMQVVKHDSKVDLVPGFVRMIGTVHSTVAAAHPKRPRIGTVAEFQPSAEYLDLPPKVCPVVDVLGFTMYPTEPEAEGTDAPPAKIQRWMAAARAAVGPCGIAITEVGASAVAPFGTPEAQVAVAASIIAWARANPKAYEFTTWYTMTDNPDPTADVYGGMGLVSRTGAKRPAYTTWLSAGK